MKQQKTEAVTSAVSDIEATPKAIKDRKVKQRRSPKTDGKNNNNNHLNQVETTSAAINPPPVLAVLFPKQQQHVQSQMAQAQKRAGKTGPQSTPVVFVSQTHPATRPDTHSQQLSQSVPFRRSTSMVVENSPKIGQQRPKNASAPPAASSPTKKVMTPARRRQQSQGSASPTNYAGAKFSESPAPMALPPPPLMWVLKAMAPSMEEQDAMSTPVRIHPQQLIALAAAS